MRTPTWLPCALTALALVGCASAPVARSLGSDAGLLKQEVFADVTGELTTVEIVDLSISGTRLHQPGSAADAATDVDRAAVDAAVDTVTAWLDAHLNEVQSGAEGRIAGAVEGDASAVSAGLANPKHPVTAARYAVTVGARGIPEWMQATVTVQREDGEMTAVFAFLPGGGGLHLVGVHVGDGTPAPIPSDDGHAEDADGEDPSGDTEDAP